MNYTTVLLDLDNTILDFKAAEKVALKNTIEHLGIPYTQELVNHYESVNHDLWSQYERGEIPKDQILETRFAEAFKSFNLPYSGIEMDRYFRNEIEENNVFMEHAEQFMEELSKQSKIIFVTNGVTETQHRRIKLANLMSYADGVVVSSETGYAKPMKEMFDYVFEKLEITDLENVIMVGDSLKADIQGGINAGIDTCWYNPQHEVNDTGIIPTHEITDLREYFKK